MIATARRALRRVILEGAGAGLIPACAVLFVAAELCPAGVARDVLCGAVACVAVAGLSRALLGLKELLRDLGVAWERFKADGRL